MPTYIDRICKNIYSPTNKQVINRHEKNSHNNNHAMYVIMTTQGQWQLYHIQKTGVVISELMAVDGTHTHTHTHNTHTRSHTHTHAHTHTHTHTHKAITWKRKTRRRTNKHRYEKRSATRKSPRERTNTFGQPTRPATHETHKMSRTIF